MAGAKSLLTLRSTYLPKPWLLALKVLLSTGPIMNAYSSYRITCPRSHADTSGASKRRVHPMQRERSRCIPCPAHSRTWGSPDAIGDRIHLRLPEGARIG